MSLFTTTTPPTSPDTTPDPGESLSNFWDFFTDVPVKIVLIIVISMATLFFVRKAIKRVAEKLATEPDKTWLNSNDRAKAILSVNPLANARRAQRSRTIGSVLRSVSTIVISVIAILLVLAQLNIDVTPLLASAGVVGVAIGFGAQSLVKDFLSGIFLILEDQYGVGDKVQIGDVNGTVESIALRITKVRDADGTLWYLRNGEVLKVGNKTHGWSVAAVEVRVPYDSDLDAARSALQLAADKVREDKKVAAALRGPIEVSGIESMSAEAIGLKVSVKTLPAKQWEVARALRENIRTVLTEHEIDMAAS